MSGKLDKAKLILTGVAVFAGFSALAILSRGLLVIGGFLMLFGWNLIPMLAGWLLGLLGVEIQTVTTVKYAVGFILTGLGVIFVLIGTVIIAYLRA